MAAPMTSVNTPRKTYFGGNLCIICGFSFEQHVTNSDSTISVVKFTDRKLKLTHERRLKIESVIDDEICAEESPAASAGVCQKCFRAVERVHKNETEILKTKKELKDSYNRLLTSRFLSLPSPQRRTGITKRMLRSPSTSLPTKKKFDSFDMLLSINMVKPVTILPFSDLKNVAVKKGQDDPDQGQRTCKTKRSLDASFQQQQNKEGVPSTTSIMGPQSHLPSTVVVEVTVYYTSGKKTTTVECVEYQRICKAFVDRSPNTDNIIIENIMRLNPEAVINGATNLIKKESKTVCKRGSANILQMKDHNDFVQFSWKHFYYEIRSSCPSILSVVSAIISDIPPPIQSKQFIHMMLTTAIGLHGRSQEMSVVQYLIGSILTHGGCTQRDIERLSKLGISVHPQTLHKKLASWESVLDQELVRIKENWAAGGSLKFQLVGDNWDKNILPSYRTTDRKTISLHLFNVYAIVDRVIPAESTILQDQVDLNITSFIPSIHEQEILLKELTFLFASSIIKNVPKMTEYFLNIYPSHLEHRYSEYAGLKTTQYPLGLYDCNENQTKEIIQLLKKLSELYVPFKDSRIVEPVFFGGDRLTDERINGAQCAMSSEASASERLEGFISKIEDFHRLMNFLEAICKLTYNTGSGGDPATMFYYRNLLNMRNVKGNVKNAYRPYKQLYYTVLDAICVVIFLKHFALTDVDSEIPFPQNFSEMSNGEKIRWLNSVCSKILKVWFFDNSEDICSSLREILENPQHDENYWVSSLEGDRFNCHFCSKTYAFVGSLKSHEINVHDLITHSKKNANVKKSKDTKDYIVMLFKLALLHKNLDSAVDMGDGERCVRSAKYELPIYHKTGKTKYSIGSIHLTALVSGLLPLQQQERLIANRCVNVQGGKNNNIALDEYLEMLNRDSKVAFSGHQTKESILRHSKEYPILVELTKHIEEISEIRKRKGFHHLPSYQTDVQTVVKDLIAHSALLSSQQLKCKDLTAERNPFDNCANKLPTMIQRHNPPAPYRRLRDLHI